MVQEITQEQIAEIAEKNVANLTVLIPPLMKDKLKEFCDAQDKSVMDFVRTLVADTIGYELPVKASRVRSSKYATDEERKNAQRKKAADRRSLVSELIKRYRESAEE